MPMTAPTTRNARLPRRTRFAAAGERKASPSGIRPEPTLAPSTSASASCGLRGPTVGERDHEQDHRDARMGDPGEERAQGERQDRIAGEPLHHEGEDALLAQGLGRPDDQAERQDHEGESDHDPADMLPEGGLRDHHQSDADQKQGRGQGRGFEGEGLDDDGRADIGPEHDGERGSKGDEPAFGEGHDEKAGGGRALQRGRDADPRGACPQTAVRGAGDCMAELGPEGFHHALPHHLGGP